MCSLPMPKGHYFAPTYKQAKSIAWDYLKHFTSTIPGMKYNKTELTATFPWGQVIMLVGADNPDSFRGQYSDSVVLDEVAMMPPKLWGEVVRPALADRAGKALFIGTPAGRNLFWELYDRADRLDGWGRCLLRYDQTQIIAASEVEAMRQELDEFEFAQELECSFTAAVRGAYYGRACGKAEKDGRVTSVPYDPNLPVITSWDLGYADATAIWYIQPTRHGEIRVIDYDEFNSHYLQEIIPEVRKKPYVYDEHIAPHDIEVHEFAAGATRRETAKNLGIHFTVAPNVPVVDGITAVRKMIDRCAFDERQTRQGFNALQLYRSEESERTGMRSKKPLHDFTCHAADALRMFAVTRAHNPKRKNSPNYDLLDAVAM